MRGIFLCVVAAGTLGALACSQPKAPADPITIDGSSTVFPLSDSVAQEFMKSSRGATVNVTFSGTGSGFQKFCRDQLDLVNASRPINADERTACEQRQVAFVELPVAHDAVTVVVNSKNSWASSITVQELRTLWRSGADGRVTQWNQVRASWPERPIQLHGPGAESGTFDYFTEAISGTSGDSRKDYKASADDEVIVKAVAGDENALGYVGYSYFERHRDTLKALAVDDLDNSIGPGAIEPSSSNVARGTYRPLARPLFIYVNVARAERPAVRSFVQFYLRQAGDLAATAGTMPLMRTAYQLAERRFSRRVTGTMYAAKDAGAMGVEYLLAQ